MAVYGNIVEFNSCLEDQNCYIEYLKNDFIANGILADTPEWWRAILVSVCGPSPYQMICNLMVLNKPPDKSHADTVKLVNDCHMP